jgi:cytosine/adenosine deaminase-related metal-dependent hydrolase
MEAIHRSQGSVVHCPGSHEFFSHPEFPLTELLRHKIPVCLGTDSLASNEGLNLFDEMRRFRMKHPHLTAEFLLEMVTRNPARALGREAELGRLSGGACADILALRIDGGQTESPYEAVLEANPDLECVMIAGEIVLDAGADRS